MLQLKIHQQPENGIFSYFSPCLINNYHCWAGFTSRIRIILALKVIVLHFNKWAVQRWQRNSTGRPLFPSQNHWKNIWTLSKLHKTTSECWQRTSGTQKSSPLSWKEVGQKIKDKKRDKRVRDGDPSLKEEKFPNTRKPSHLRVCGELWNLRGQHNWEEKINK